MKKIVASNDPTKYAQVDDDVFEIIKDMKLKFSVHSKAYFYSTTKIKLSGMKKKKRLYLHHLVWLLKTGTEPELTVDHRDIDPLNNQFENLRLATMLEQSQHRGKMKNNKSGFIGISHQHRVKKYKDKTYENDYWRASIRKPDGKDEQKFFPYTENGLIEAAKYYDTKAIEYHGEFHGQLNFPDDR